jgi:hypothetical protein
MNLSLRTLTGSALALILALWPGCKDDDNTTCEPYAASWQLPAKAIDLAWVFISDEDGQLLLEQSAGAQDDADILTEECADARTLSTLTIGSTTVTDDGTPRTETLYQLTTVVDAPNGFDWDTLTLLPLQEWEVTINNVSSLERLFWPAEGRATFQGDIVLDPAADVLGFAFDARGDEAAYFELTANGDGFPKGIFFSRVDSSSLIANYNAAPLIFGLGTVNLPDNNNWQYNLYGEADGAQALLDYPSQPDLVSGSFSPRSPSVGVDRHRLRVNRPTSFNGMAYDALAYDFIPSGFPITLSNNFPVFDYQRTGEQLAITTSSDAPLVYEIRIFDYTGPGPWIDWTIYGTPEALSSFLLPDWPSMVAAQRSQLLGAGRSTAIQIRGLQLQSNVTYADFLDALANKNQNWLWEEGLVERSIIADY